MWKHEMRAGVMNEIKHEATQALFPSRHTTTTVLYYLVSATLSSQLTGVLAANHTNKETHYHN